MQPLINQGHPQSIGGRPKRRHMDSTSTQQTCFLEGCKNKFKPSKAKKFCCPEHQEINQTNVLTGRRAKNKRKLEAFAWQQTNLGRLYKWYDLFGVKHECDICQKTFEESLDEYKIPLFMELKLDIRNYRVLDHQSWTKYCLKCYCEVLSLRDD